jgi:hypothetical protein
MTLHRDDRGGKGNAAILCQAEPERARNSLTLPKNPADSG